MQYGNPRWRSVAMICAVFPLGISLTSKAAEPPAATVDVAQPLADVLQPAESADAAPAEPTGRLPEDLRKKQNEKEVVRQRYPNGAVRIAREVAQDAEGNYVNHGCWKYWDAEGKLIAEGQYRYGKREGTWTRWHRATDSPLFATPPYQQFQGPFLSRATFHDGQLDGKWTILDAGEKVISQWAFVKGRRHGESAWYYPNGQKMAAVTYQEAMVTGQSFWKPDGQLIRKDSFDHGRKVEIKTTYYKGTQQKKTEAGYLGAKIVKRTEADWWHARPATFTAEGNEQKHGAWSRWYPNGQLAQAGKFQYGVPVGKFTWWYSNGQKALEGIYQNGRPSGRWTWWHANGQKKSVGQYAAGTATGVWTWWRSDGKLTYRSDLAAPAARIAARSSRRDHTPASQSPAPAAPISGKR